MRQKPGRREDLQKAASEPAQWTVHGLVQALKETIESIAAWQQILVVGELSGLKRHTSGHWYFTLKDEKAQIRSVMFRRDAERTRFLPEDGMAVMVSGRIGVFERDGQTQLYVTQMIALGAGDQHLALERLKRRLDAEGLFSRPKRRLPRLPTRVGLVTSPTGAARHDVQTVVERRFPGLPVILYPVLVQGAKAAESIVSALESVTERDVDVVILGRGGGSKEDLMVFNDEAVVRALANLRVPVISAVGHEIDTTLSDLVADLRAPTPSAAAELAVPERARLVEELMALRSRSRMALSRRLRMERERINGWVSHGILKQSASIVERRRTNLDRLDERMERFMERKITGERYRLDRLSQVVSGLNPTAVLERGYTYVSDRDGVPVEYGQIRRHHSYLVHWYNGSRWMTELEDAD
jgi:exodeoxyribonuclease VII large subunit